jgi:hypothetical protein
MPRDIVRFVVNMPVIVVLQFQAGKPVEGQYGPQVMFSLADNKVMYLDPLPAKMLEVLQPMVGEEFVITQKWTGRRGDQREWDVHRRLIRDGDSELERKLEQSIAQAEGRKAAASASAATSAPPMPARGTGTYGPAAVPAPAVKQIPQKRQYADAFALFLVDAGRATLAAERALAGEGGSVRFDSRDLAAIATSMFIAADKNGFLTWDGGGR